MVDHLHKIISGCQENDPRAQRELYDMFRTKMFGTCLRYAGNYEDAQDILQEGFIKVFEKINQFAFKGAFEGWIRRIMVNTALEKYRVHYRHMVTEENAVMPVNEESEDITAEMEARELVNIIQELTPRYRVVFNMYALDGYSHKEISEMLNISEGTSKSNLSRARTILQEKVNKYYLRTVQMK
ncbi:MAG TPA: sigma-70 family RNA polymerase sigma factor [Bacteroidales bacterium]|nr:sigma-70 family RNA polymerase sigma factor [Bacteroidales bacterium]